MRGRGASLPLEALPPDLRDLTLLGQNGLARLGTVRRRPSHSGAWVDARVASQQSSIPRPGNCSVAAEWNRTFHLLIKADNLTCYQHGKPRSTRPKTPRC